MNCTDVAEVVVVGAVPFVGCVNETLGEALLDEAGALVLVVVTLEALTVAGLVGAAVELGAAVLSEDRPPVTL